MLRTSCLKRILIFAIEIIILGVFAAVCRVSAAVPDDNEPLTLNIADGDITINSDNTITCGSTTYRHDDQNQQITITGTTKEYAIKVIKMNDEGALVNIILDNVNIDVSATPNKAAFEIETDSAANVNITLVGDNTLKSGENCAGLQKTGNAAGVGTLTIDGTGSLTAAGDKDCAGIGGRNALNITINGGTITAVNSRGIGDNSSTASERYANVVINGGSVKTDNPLSFAKNGNGKEVGLLALPVGSATSVKIDNTTYQPTRHGTEDTLYVYLTKKEPKKHVVEIGDKKTTYIYDGNIIRELIEFDITPTNSSDTITENVDYTYDSTNCWLKINTDIPITIANKKPGIPTPIRIYVESNFPTNITLAGVNIDVSKNSYSAFAIAENSTKDVTITLAEGSENILKSGSYRAGLQKDGENTDVGELIIKGTGSLTAQGGLYGAGIGGGYEKSTSKITIISGEVTAIGDYSGAGIGGGSSGNGSNINISGGKVTAKGGGSAAGIGGGYGGYINGGIGSNINISGGTVIATGGEFAAGIGGGKGKNNSTNGKGIDITISGGAVTATGGGGSSGIGGGFLADGSVTISGGVVTATSGTDGAAIGGGDRANGSVTISGGAVTAIGVKTSDNTDGVDIGGGCKNSGPDVVKISGGSVKAANISVNPTDTTGGEEVYPFEIHTGGRSVTIETADGKTYQAPSTHDGDTIYVYLPAGDKDQNKYNSIDIGGEPVKCYYDESSNGWCSSPIISPYGGSFSSSLEVKITCTEGSTIYYTTDGTNPTDSSTHSATPITITISDDTTIKAFSVKGSFTSEVVTAKFRKRSESPIQPIKPPTHDLSNISIDVQLGGNAPKTEIATTLENLAENVLTDSDWKKANDGTKIKIILTVNDATQTVSDTDKSKINAEISKNSYTAQDAYLDISLMKVVGDVQEVITETHEPITITLEIPEEIRSKNRVYAAARFHNGETTILPDLDDNENTVTVQTDKFSTYTIVYKDIEQGEGSGTSTSDGSTSTSDGGTSGNSSGNSPDGSTSGSGNPDGSKDNPYTGGVSAMAVSMLAALGALAAVLACASKGKK